MAPFFGPLGAFYIMCMSLGVETSWLDWGVLMMRKMIRKPFVVLRRMTQTVSGCFSDMQKFGDWPWVIWLGEIQLLYGKKSHRASPQDAWIWRSWVPCTKTWVRSCIKDQMWPSTVVSVSRSSYQSSAVAGGGEQRDAPKKELSFFPFILLNWMPSHDDDSYAPSLFSFTF